MADDGDRLLRRLRPEPRQQRRARCPGARASHEDRLSFVIRLRENRRGLLRRASRNSVATTSIRGTKRAQSLGGLLHLLLSIVGQGRRASSLGAQDLSLFGNAVPDNQQLHIEEKDEHRGVLATSGRRTFSALAMRLLCSASPPRSRVLPDTAHVVIVATTDVHGRRPRLDYVRAYTRADGLSRLRPLERCARALSRHVVLVDAGDLLQAIRSPRTTVATIPASRTRWSTQ